MTRKLFYFVLFTSIYMNAQTTIVEEKYEKKNVPVNFKYLPNSEKFIIMKGKTIPMGVAPFIYNVYSYDVNGKKDIILENEELVDLTYSATESSFKSYDLSKLRFSAKYDYKYFFDNKHVKTIPFADLKDFGDAYFGYSEVDNRIRQTFGRQTFSNFSNSFNDFYELGFTNQKGKEDINFEKDDVYLETLEIKTNTKKRFKLDKPDLSLLKGTSFVEFDQKTTFNCRLNGNDNFDLITKSLSSDSKTSILYKTTYDFKGKKLRDISFKLDLKSYFFITSNNYGGSLDFSPIPGTHDVHIIPDVLSINNYYEDKQNSDVYIYGIFSDTTPKHKARKGETASGYYIFKFDKEGNKIWESINAIDDKEYLQKIGENGRLDVSLLEYNQNLLFTISVNDFTEFTHTAVIEKPTGKVLKSSFIEYNNNTYIGGKGFFIRPTYESKQEFKNKSFTPICFAALCINDKYSKYVKSLPSKGNHKYFETVFSNQGIWLVETDNEEYFKITLFKE